MYIVENLILKVEEIFGKKIYVQKKKEIKIIRLREFNFELLHKIIPCGKILCKWKENISENVFHVMKLKLKL